MGATVLSSRWWETAKGGGADVDAVGDGGLGGDGEKKTHCCNCNCASHSEEFYDSPKVVFFGHL